MKAGVIDGNSSEGRRKSARQSLHDLTHRREIRSVASAFVGEIAAILHLIETHDVVSHDVVSMVEKALDAPGSAVALPNLTLPAFTIYTADAAKLDELPLPVPRKIARVPSTRDPERT